MHKIKENIALVDLDNTLTDYQILNFEKKTELQTTPGFWLNLPKIPYGFAVVNELEKAGYSIHVVTKGPYKAINAWSEKVQWCRTHLPQAKVTITEDKGLIYGRVLFDDWPPYVSRWLQWRPRGLVLMPEKVWNKGFKHPQVIHIPQIPDMDYGYLQSILIQHKNENN